MKYNLFLKCIVWLFYIFVIGAACTIPFYFESPSIFYKVGLDKLMLRTGKIFGIITVVLMMFQLIFVAKFLWFERVFGLKNLYNFHRRSGVVLLVTALIHPVLILGADHFVFFPFEAKYWAEFVGIILLFKLIFFVLISHWQKNIGITYKTWRYLHKILAPILFSLTAIHVFNVSRTFESDLPFYALWGTLVIITSLIVRKSLKP